MLLDNQNVLSDAQAFSADAITTNVIDLVVTGRRIGAGEPMAIVLFVDTAADFTTTDETYSFIIRTDDDVAFGSPTSLSASIKTAAQLTAGSWHTFLVPPETSLERYLGLFFDGGGTTPTITGTIALMPLSAVRKFKDYGNAFTITH